MPANPKYLTQSGWQKFGKITAAILGAYLVAMALHLALASWFNHVVVLTTSAFSSFIAWVCFMIVAFLAKNSLKIWGLYIFLSLVFYGIAVLGKMYNPEFLQK